MSMKPSRTVEAIIAAVLSTLAIGVTIYVVWVAAFIAKAIGEILR